MIVGTENCDLAEVVIDDDGKLRLAKVTIEDHAVINLGVAQLMDGGVVVMPRHVR